MSTPRLVRAIGGAALLAAGSAGLAACTTRLPLTPQPETRERGGVEPTTPATAAVLCGGGGAEGHSAGSPGRTDTWSAERSVGGYDLLPRPWRTEKSYAVAAGHILAYEFLLNQFDRNFISQEEYGSDLESIQDNLDGPWVYDEDPFKMNQFMHPYGGSIYFGFARAAGLGFWESFGYAVAGSAIWEIAGETTPPSINDQITTPIAGTYLGEVLYRSANLILGGGCGRPSAGQERLAFLVSPPTGFTRWAYGDRFDAIFPSHDPAVFWTWGGGLRRYSTLTDTGVQAGLERDVAFASISVDYGLPGKRGYAYDRPFDYFHLDATATTVDQSIPETVAIRGLLLGDDYASGPKYAGIWGVYGNYDYLSPQIFKLSSTAVTVGTTGQWLVSDKVALQGSLLAGVGFTSSGTTANERVQRSYRYSVAPQALVALRAVYDDVAMLDVTANEYFLADSLDSTRASGSENVARVQVSLTVRVFGRHAIGLGYVEARRDARFESILDVPQSVGSFSLFYTHLSDTRFGVVR